MQAHEVSGHEARQVLYFVVLPLILLLVGGIILRIRLTPPARKRIPMFRKTWFQTKVTEGSGKFSVHFAGLTKGIIYQEGDGIFHLEVEPGPSSPDWIIYGKSTAKVSVSGKLEPVSEEERLRINRNVRDALFYMRLSFVMD